MAAEPGATPDARRAMAAWYLLWVHRGFLNIFMTLGLSLLFALLILRGGADDLESNHRKSRAEMLALAPAAVPDADNAALNYKAAFAARAPFVGQWTDSPEHRSSRSDSAFFATPVVQTYLRQNAKTIELLIKASEQLQCNWNLNYSMGFNIPMPHMAQMRDGTRLLLVYARDRARRGDHAEAVRALEAIHTMARHAESDPILLAGLVSIAMQTMASDVLEAIVLWDTPREEADIARYRKSSSVDLRWRERLTKLMEGEKKFILQALDEIVAEYQKKGTWGPAAIGMNNYPGGLVFWYGSDRRCCEAVMDEIIDAIRGGRFSHTESAESRITRLQTGPAVFANELMPILIRSEVSFIRAAEKMRAIEAGLAFLHFRAKHQRDPKSLDELVPEFLPAVPHGIFHDKPLLMRIDPAGILEKLSGKTGPPTRLHPGVIRIYTLGENGKDDQGFLMDSGEQLPTPRTTSEEDDISFRLSPPATKTVEPEAKQ